MSPIGRVFAAAPYVRRNVGPMTEFDSVIVSYRAGVRAMKALPPSDPRSWSYQAAIHGTTITPTHAAWNTCEHGTVYFWSWHRMYLYWFERIVRKMANDPCWALPHWNWSSPAERQLPAPFRDAASELYTTHRDPSMNSGAGSLPASDVDYSAAFGFFDFQSADVSIQGIPHGAVHVDVGGWMSSVPTAAQDPIFYLHHCNIDRLWDLWLAQGGGRMDPVGDPSWRGKTYTFFDENGNPVHMTDCDVLRAAQQLDYVYEGEAAQVNDYCPPRIHLPPFELEEVLLLQIPIRPVTLGSEPVSFPINIQSVRQQLLSATESKTETVVLELDDVEAERQPGVVWDVYVGLPAGQSANPASPFHVGGIALFGSGIRSEKQHGFSPARFVFSINRALAAAFRANESRVLVTFVPHGILVDGRPRPPKVAATVRIGHARLMLQTRKPTRQKQE